MINFPPAKKWPTHIPLLAFSVGAENKRTLARSDQYPNTAHSDPAILVLDSLDRIQSMPTHHVNRPPRQMAPEEAKSFSQFRYGEWSRTLQMLVSTGNERIEDPSEDTA